MKDRSRREAAVLEPALAPPVMCYVQVLNCTCNDQNRYKKVKKRGKQRRAIYTCMCSHLKSRPSALTAGYSSSRSQQLGREGQVRQC